MDRNGSINIPRIGQINLAGIRYQDLTGYVKTAVERVFRNFELTVTMGQLRSIQVLVLGHARRPGNYTVSSLSTLVNAIFAAGGPSPRGSMRGIQLKRGNRNVTELDLYDLWVNGDKSRDAPLLPGDIIYFPPIGPLAALSGSVNTPTIFELKTDTSLAQLIGWSGGLSTTAQTRRATIERIEDRQRRVVDQFSIDASGLKRAVRDGDLINVFSISPKFENAVTLRGNVAAPLRYPYREGMRIRDLIPEKEALITPEYYLRRNFITRSDILNSPVAPGEAQENRQANRQANRQTIRQSTGQQQLIEQVRLLTAEINWDYAVIERLSERDLSTVLLPFNLGKAVIEGDASQNLPLRPGDVVTIFSTRDLAVPVARQTKLVRLEGEFANPGVYRVEPGETLRQFVVRMGGFPTSLFVWRGIHPGIHARSAGEES